MIRIIATCTNNDLGLIEETEVVDVNEKIKQSLVDLGWAKIYDDTKPMVGKSVNIYEPKVYPKDRQVFYNDSVYISKVTTSDHFVKAEWKILVTGRDAA
jgi:hypothetical protein